MPHGRIIGFKAHMPRDQAKTTGKQDGTPPKRLKGKRMRMNIQDQMRAWQNTLDGGTIVEVRKASVEILAQLRHTLGHPVPALPVDITAKHYQEVCATVDNLREFLADQEKTSRKTVSLAAVREIVGEAA